MQITDVDIYNGDGKNVIAYCSITIDSCLKIEQMRVLRNENKKLYVVMPSRRKVEKCTKCDKNTCAGFKFCHHCGTRIERNQVKNYFYSDIVIPLNAEIRNLIEVAILSKLGEVNERL